MGNKMAMIPSFFIEIVEEPIFVCGKRTVHRTPKSTYVVVDERSHIVSFNVGDGTLIYEFRSYNSLLEETGHIAFLYEEGLYIHISIKTGEHVIYIRRNGEKWSSFFTIALLCDGKNIEIARDMETCVFDIKTNREVVEEVGLRVDS